MRCLIFILGLSFEYVIISLFISFLRKERREGSTIILKRRENLTIFWAIFTIKFLVVSFIDLFTSFFFCLADDEDKTILIPSNECCVNFFFGVVLGYFNSLPSMLQSVNKKAASTLPTNRSCHTPVTPKMLIAKGFLELLLYSSNHHIFHNLVYFKR